MKSVLSITLLLLFITGINAQSKPLTASGKLLIGRWISTEDKSYTMTITASNIVEYYGKEKTSTSTYQIDKEILIKTDAADGQVYKYDIMSLTKKRMTLMYLDRGNLLLFKRMK